ncbi:Site-specific DNA recombinase [Mariprofundus aestuarium]|uniref:Site-specific DNA recombinase n=1 Tax=Mariprofundus aestuarium TaxID=1921086 RepID=A0A2K8KX77_MARES|nr:recombinase family protein [Mariprofundus aestuarium]ATX79535.1 Site-specific DNA recombinase [Mariprofundus aestuarium]
MQKAYSYVRFSTPQQLKGDSLRRQLEASRAYAKQYNLVLDESLRDIGVSAFKGKNATEGALRRFIELVEAGRIEKGSILILESLDRLSRQQVFAALGLFSSILSAGVEIVTLADGQHYTADSINEVGQLMYSLMSLSRSHEESAMKSKRLSASWENKRQNAVESGKPMTKQCPKWLAVSEDRQRFEVIEERASIIRRIFDMSIAGTGQRKIAEQFNKEGIKPFARGDMWHASYIRKVLNSKVVLGEFQPMKDKEQIGDPIPDYYPPIISEELYYKAKAAQKQRRTDSSSAGRKGESYSNLFTGMCKCMSCGSTFRMIKNGHTHQFRCNSNYMASGCDCTKRWPYREVEDAALVALSEKVDWYSALGGHVSSRQKLESEIKSLSGKLAECMKQVERFGELVATAEGSMFADARARYTKAMHQADEIQQEIDEKEAELKIFSPVQEKVDRLSSAIFDLRFSKLPADELYQLRAHINSTMREAGLVLHFFDLGVIYEITGTGEAGVVITEAQRTELALLARAEIANLGLKGLKEKLLHVQSMQDQ